MVEEKFVGVVFPTRVKGTPREVKKWREESPRGDPEARICRNCQNQGFIAK